RTCWKVDLSYRLLGRRFFRVARCLAESPLPVHRSALAASGARRRTTRRRCESFAPLSGLPGVSRHNPAGAAALAGAAASTRVWTHRSHAPSSAGTDTADHEQSPKMGGG